MNIYGLGNGVEYNDDKDILRYERANTGLLYIGELPFDFYIIRLFYKDGSAKDIRAYCEAGTSANLKKEEKDEFFFKRLFGEKGLIVKERRTDYLFLGGINKENDGIRFSRFNKDKTGKTMQRIIDDRVEKLWPQLLLKGNPKDFDLINFDFYFHSGNEDTEEVFQNGLRSRFGSGATDGFCSLESTFHHVVGSWCEYSRLHDCVMQYGKGMGRYTYIIKIPSIYRGSRVMKNGNLYPPMPTHRLIDYESGDSYIISEIIYGVYDSITNEIYLNPNYNPKYDPEGLSYDHETYDNIRFSGAADFEKWCNFMESRRKLTFRELERKDKKSREKEYSIESIRNIYGIDNNVLKQSQTFDFISRLNIFNSSRHK